MEQPSGTDDLHTPQDLSTSTLNTVLDLTRKDPRALFKESSAWFHNADPNNPGVSLSETTPCGAQHEGQIQPDDAFSPTTVTLSYVSRSHIFTHDPLSGSSSVYGVPTISKYSLQPPSGTEVALNQHYLDKAGEAADTSTQTEILQSLSRVQIKLEETSKQTFEFNQDSITNVDSHLSSTEQGDDNRREHLPNGGTLWLEQSLDVCAASLSQRPVALKVSKSLQNESNCSFKSSDSSRDRCDSVENLAECSSQESSKSSLDFSQECLEFFPESSESITEQFRAQSKRDEGLENGLQESTQTFEVLSAPLGEYGSLLRECPGALTENTSDTRSSDVFFVSSTPEKTPDRRLGVVHIPVGSPVSSPSTSLDNTDVSMFPEGSGSVQETRESLSKTERRSRSGLPSENWNKCTVYGRKSTPTSPIDLTDDDCEPNVLEDDLNNSKVLNGHGGAEQTSENKREAPVRSSRGRRLGAIVMSINSSRYAVSGCIRTGKRRPQIDANVTLRKSNRLSLSNKKCESKEKTSAESKTSPGPCRRSTSDLEPRTTESSPQERALRCKRTVSKSQTEGVARSCPDRTSRSRSPKAGSPKAGSPKAGSPKAGSPKAGSPKAGSPKAGSPKAGSPKAPAKIPSKAKNMSPTKKPRPRAKTKSSLKKKHNVFKGGDALSLFGPKEPEIRLKYVNYKEKRCPRESDFKAFVRVRGKEEAPSSCTLINYPDEVKMPSKSNQSRGASLDYSPAAVPTTSCLRLGRTTMQGDQQRALVCCLCGQAANAMDLGDLHGPYYSEGHKPPAKRPNEGSEVKGGGSSESDLSDSESCAGSKKRWGAEEGGSPAAKRPRADPEDWYSPPVVPLGPCEYWLHEDCGVWSAGVFLVRGRIYGLEEAVRAAQSTKCSSCGDGGASLGCLCKGCTSKYHFKCALQSDCDLMEDNFSMRCQRHRTRTNSESRQEDRLLPLRAAWLTPPSAAVTMKRTRMWLKQEPSPTSPPD